jgi:hypothetical protein
MFPTMRDVLAGFGRRNQFARVSKTAVDYEVSETKASVQWFVGVFQPIPTRKLIVKPEGQRTWKWWTLWTNQSLNLDDIVQDQCNKQFRVMSVEDWGEAGYYTYELAEQPRG